MTDQPGAKASGMGLGDLGGLLGSLTGQQGGVFALLLAVLTGGAGGLGGLLGGAAGGTGGGAGGSTGGIEDVLGGLLGGAAGGTSGGAGGSTGGAGGLGGLESMLGGVMGDAAGGATSGTSGVGIGNTPQALSQLISMLESKGLGDVAHSWVGTGANQPISPDALSHALGPDLIGQLANTTGMSPGDIVSKLSTALPSVVDGLTPNGTIPTS